MNNYIIVCIYGFAAGGVDVSLKYIEKQLDMLSLAVLIGYFSED